jgi:hypothetical protein
MLIPFRIDFHPATFFFSARNFAHRFLVALPIFALAAADITRFFTPLSSLLVESPKAFLHNERFGHPRPPQEDLQNLSLRFVDSVNADG